MKARESFEFARRRLARTGLAGLLVVLLGSSMAADSVPRDTAAKDTRTTEQQAATQYVANLERLLETDIVPGIKRGILNAATPRPHALTVEITNDPSPYDVGVKIDPDGSLTVRISIGYLTMHDAALDAVALSAALQRPRNLCRYLMYQLHLAHENYMRRTLGTRARHAMPFAEFAGLDPKVTQAIFAQPQWLASRNRVQADSVGWTVAFLLVEADAKLAGMSSIQAASDGAGAARLAAASGWFPVPPVATALGIAAIEHSAAATFDERALLCRAASLMEAGVEEIRANTQWRAQPDRDASLQSRIGEIRAQIASMQRDGDCASDGAVRT